MRRAVIVAAWLSVVAVLAPVASALGAEAPTSPPTTTVHRKNLAREDRCLHAQDATARVWRCSLLLNGTPPAPADAAAYHLSRGYAFLAFGWQDAALHDFAKTLELAPGTIEAHQVRAQLYRRRQAYDLAAQEITSLIAVSPQDPLLFVERAAVLSYAGDFNLAIADATNAIAMAESYEPIADFYLQRARIYELAGRYDEALKDAGTARARNGDAARAREAEGRLLYLTGDWQGAKAALEDAIALGAGPYAPLWLDLAELRLNRSDALPAGQTTQDRLWPTPIESVLEGRKTVSEIAPFPWSLDRDAAQAAARKRCDAFFFAGEGALARGQSDAARALFAKAEETGARDVLAYGAAKARLRLTASAGRPVP